MRHQAIQTNVFTVFIAGWGLQDEPRHASQPNLDPGGRPGTLCVAGAHLIESPSPLPRFSRKDPQNASTMHANCNATIRKGKTLD
eukprot:4387290-Amphidinium_carterae.1